MHINTVKTHDLKATEVKHAEEYTGLYWLSVLDVDTTKKSASARSMISILRIAVLKCCILFTFPILEPI